MTKAISQRIAEELSVLPSQVDAAIKLLDEGATVPFIARYRKEATGALDDTQMRQLNERLLYLREMEDRRRTILDSIVEQGKLSADLEQAIMAAETKNRLEDLYLPYKPRRRSKALIAREAGLEPLADSLVADPTLEPEKCALEYLNEDAGFGDSKAALDGARQILMERFAEDADLLAALRQFLSANGLLASRLLDGKSETKLLDKLLAACRSMELIKPRGKQRTDATHVLAAVRVMNRLEQVAETMRAALNEIAAQTPGWLQGVAPEEWYKRYGRRIEDNRLPQSKAGREEFGQTVGEDGVLLLDLITQPDAPEGLNKLPMIEELRQVWARHYEK